MDSGNIILRPVRDLLGMSFFIPDYQRGYRWEEQQAKDLLSDIEAFICKIKDTPNSSEIYCIQPLVVQYDKEKNERKILENLSRRVEEGVSSIAEIKEIIKEKWDVVDGQQRLTTIFLILQFLKVTPLYSIEYQTRTGSEDFLNNYLYKKAEENIDFYHIEKVRQAIGKWFEQKDENFINVFKNTLLDKVKFIWYQLSDSENAISVFTRLNIGKIPLTNSELIKALFLNRSNFRIISSDLTAIQLEIASQWDEIETTLQNDEFWLFIHNKNYDKPTRIDFILDYICKEDILKVGGKRDITNKKIKEKIGNDEYTTFRYFYEAIEYFKKNQDAKEWLSEIWQKKIRHYFEIFNEWYSDYQLFHYVGYVLETDIIKINELISKYNENNMEKEIFIKWVKDKIKTYFHNNDWFWNLETYDFASDNEDKSENNKSDKTVCRPLLLLHNIETIIQQNKKLVEESKYNLPNFNKFPFHLYKSENWQVEHIHPNAGEKLKEPKDKKLYLLLAKKALLDDNSLCENIDKYISGDDKIIFEDLYKDINEYASPISEKNKNKIYNFTLLDETTNKEYQNSIFPIKRAFLASKEQGYKPVYEIKNNELDPNPKKSDEIAFVPVCTKNVFAKNYTELPSSLMAWTDDDAKGYLGDIKNKLKYYFTKDT